jgi:hypothetical protein
MVKSRDDILREEFGNVALESAWYKAQRGDLLRLDQVNEALAAFLHRYDWVIVFWPEPRNPSGMGASIVRDSGKETGFSRCQSIVCVDRETGLKLHSMCRGPDNHAPEPPPEPTAGAKSSVDSFSTLPETFYPNMLQ